MTISKSNSNEKFFMIHHASHAFDLYCYEQNEQDGIVLYRMYNLTSKSVYRIKRLTI